MLKIRIEFPEKNRKELHRKIQTYLFENDYHWVSGKIVQSINSGFLYYGGSNYLCCCDTGTYASDEQYSAEEYISKFIDKNPKNPPQPTCSKEKKEKMNKKEEAYDFIVNNKIEEVRYSETNQANVFKMSDGSYYSCCSRGLCRWNTTPSPFETASVSFWEKVSDGSKNAALSVAAVPLEITKNLFKGLWCSTTFLARRWRYAAFAAICAGIYSLNPELFNAGGEKVLDLAREMYDNAR